ncbi:MAG TPA: TOBE domain-containing protein [Terriglobales bacterium]|nr:TOBE domain-containing protein [Terriglobales bacterium]
MKLSARNQLKGKIIEVKKGATTTHVRIDIGGHDHCFHHERIRRRTPARRPAKSRRLIKARSVLVGID